MFIDVNQFKSIIAQAVYAGVKQALTEEGAPKAAPVADPAPNKEQVEKVVADLTDDKPLAEEKPKKPRKPRKKKTDIKEVTPEKQDFEDEPEAKEAAPAEEMSPEEFISQIKANAGEGGPVKAKQLLKSLVGAIKFADCPADRRAEFIEALKNA